MTETNHRQLLPGTTASSGDYRETANSLKDTEIIQPFNNQQSTYLRPNLFSQLRPFAFSVKGVK